MEINKRNKGGKERQKNIFIELKEEGCKETKIFRPQKKENERVGGENGIVQGKT